MKKILMTLVIACFPVVASAQSAVNGNGQAVATQSQNQTQVQNQVNNPDTGVQTQTESQVQTQSASSETSVQLNQQNSVQNRSQVADAVNAMIESSYQIQNEGVGTNIRNIAQTQLANNVKIDNSIDEADARTAFAKFFIGPNYKELKNARQYMEQNELQIRTLQKLQLEIANEGEAENIASQINLLLEQQTSLQNDLNDMVKGFSLLGWLFKYFYHY